MTKRLLIVDDAPFMRLVIRDIAQQEGWEVVAEASNGEDAVPLYERYRPDLVTLDLEMPKMDGRETLQSLRQIDPHGKVVIISPLKQKETWSELIKAGAMEFIAKPFEREQVAALLKKIGA